MRFAPRNLLWILPLAMLVSAPAWKGPLGRFLAPRGGLDLAASALAGRTFRMEGVVFSQMNRDQVEWRLEAGEMASGDNENDLRFTDIRALLYGEAPAGEEAGATVITSPRGRYDTETEILDLLDNVVVQAEGGYELHADSAAFAARRNQVTAKGGVRLSGGNFKASGRQFRFDLASRNMELEGQVRFQAW